IQRRQPLTSGSPTAFYAASPAQVWTSSPPAVTPKTSELVASYTLTPDDLVVRGVGGTDVPSVMVPATPGLVELQLPVAREDLHKSFRVDLKPFLANVEILRESPLRAKATASGAMVRFWVPTALLEANQDYAVDLRSWGSPGKLEDVGTY